MLPDVSLHYRINNTIADRIVTVRIMGRKIHPSLGRISDLKPLSVRFRKNLLIEPPKRLILKQAAIFRLRSIDQRANVSNTWKGFINSIARVNRYLNLCAAAAYILYLLLYARRIWRNKGWAKRDESGTMAEIVFGSVAVNCFVVGAMIFCQPRYMIYSMGLFYTALSMMIYDEIKGRALWRNGNKGKWLGNEEKNHR